MRSIPTDESNYLEGSVCHLLWSLRTRDRLFLNANFYGKRLTRRPDRKAAPTSCEWDKVVFTEVQNKESRRILATVSNEMRTLGPH